MVMTIREKFADPRF